jgi:hypothetical protein
MTSLEAYVGLVGSWSLEVGVRRPCGGAAGARVRAAGPPPRGRRAPGEPGRRPESPCRDGSRATDRRDLIGGLSTARPSETVGLISRTIRIIARATFLSASYRSPMSFIGSPGPLNTWQCAQVTPSAAETPAWPAAPAGVRCPSEYLEGSSSAAAGAPPPPSWGLCATPSEPARISARRAKPKRKTRHSSCRVPLLARIVAQAQRRPLLDAHRARCLRSRGCSLT